MFYDIIYLLYTSGRFEQNDVCCVEINCSRPFTLLKQIMFNIDNTDFFCGVQLFEKSLSLKISSQEPSKTSKQFSNCEMNSNPENLLK